MSSTRDSNNIERKVDDTSIHDHTESNTTDERLARDMQLALDLQMAEDFAAEQATSHSHSATLDATNFQVEHGFFNAQQQQQDDRMLFVACTIDGRKVDLLVDSGASVSAMSLIVVQKLGLMDKLNVSVSGACGGVGNANIVGAVENLACLVGHVEFRLYFLVIDSQLPSVVLGLDQMRRFKCVIDMESDCLCFGGSDGVKVSFLNARDARKARNDYERLIRDAAAGGGGRRHASATTASSTGSRWIPSLFGRNRHGTG